MAYDASRDEVVLFGGSFGSSYSNETWIWDCVLRNWSQEHPANSPSARQAHALAYDVERGVVVLFGGWNGDTLGDTWEWDGTDWSPKLDIAGAMLDRHELHLAGVVTTALGQLVHFVHALLDQFLKLRVMELGTFGVAFQIRE